MEELSVGLILPKLNTLHTGKQDLSEGQLEIPSQVLLCI